MKLSVINHLDLNPLKTQNQKWVNHFFSYRYPLHCHTQINDFKHSHNVRAIKTRGYELKFDLTWLGPSSFVSSGPEVISDPLWVPDFLSGSEESPFSLFSEVIHVLVRCSLIIHGNKIQNNMC